RQLYPLSLHDALPILLLSPPTANGSMIIKDQYCSNTSKAGYYWIPVDLLVLSGDLADHFDLKVLDAIIEKKDRDEVEKEILHFEDRKSTRLNSSHVKI